MPPCHPWAIPEIQDGVKYGSLTMILQYWDFVMHKINTQSLYNHLNIPNKMFSHLFESLRIQNFIKDGHFDVNYEPRPLFFFINCLIY